jgi:hypothetical protein
VLEATILSYQVLIQSIPCSASPASLTDEWAILSSIPEKQGRFFLSSHGEVGQASRLNRLNDLYSYLVGYL